MAERLQRADARARGVPRAYFGTDGPGFYERPGALDHTSSPGPATGSCASTSDHPG